MFPNAYNGEMGAYAALRTREEQATELIRLADQAHEFAENALATMPRNTQYQKAAFIAQEAWYRGRESAFRELAEKLR